MKRLLFLMFFVPIAQLFYGQEKYTIYGELPDHSLDNTYLLLRDMSALGDERERMSHAFRDSILVKDGKFVYEGVLSRKPFLAWIYSLKNSKILNTHVVIEAGDIHIRVTNWADKAVVSGTPINEDYQTYMAAEKGLRNPLCFFEKYTSYPDVIRLHLSFWIKGKDASEKPYLSKFLQVLDRMPEADRKILLNWRDYTIQREEYKAKTRSLLDSIDQHRPRYVETVTENQSIAQPSNKQERYTIHGELPDHSLDGSYLILRDISMLGDEYERLFHSFRDSILVKDGKFVYEGVLSRKPFLAYIHSPKNNIMSARLVVEPGDIHIRVKNWVDRAHKAVVVSGTPINNDYQTYMINGKGYEDRLYFFEKYTSYPDVIRYPLSFHIKGKKASKDRYFSRYMQVVDKMPEADRKILLNWRDYTIQRDEYKEKTQPLLDSINKHRPRYVETPVKDRSQR